MQLRKFRLKFRRNVRNRKKQAVDLTSTAEDSLDKYVVNRLTRLMQVKRFVIGWISLLVLISVASFMQTTALDDFHQQLVPAEGGIYREGIVGTFTNANPIYAQTEVDTAVSRLVFSGLFKYDADGKLVGDLAERYELDPTEKIYKVYLKKDIKWQDDRSFTSADVVYTISAIQDPESKSYLFTSWRGVSVKAQDQHTITFELTDALGAFPHSLTVGILPSHILKSVSNEQLRSSSFNNQQPIGTGPFKFQSVELDVKEDKIDARIVMEANDTYHGGAPMLESFVVRSFNLETDLIDEFKAKNVDSMVGLTSTPDDVSEDEATFHRVTMSGQVMVFFNNSEGALNSKNIRRALSLGINKLDALSTLGYPVLPVNQPLIPQQTGYNIKYAQVVNKKAEANKILDDEGWKRSTATGIRQKDGKPLKFKLYSATNPEFTALSANLQKQWRELGAEAEVILQSDQDLSATVSSHNYESLMYGIAVGADPDVYVYWHGSQSDIRSQTRLNLSEYDSAVADSSLEAGRTRSDPKIRAIKYKPFLEAWQGDYPALALYQQQFLYVSINDLEGFDSTFMHSSADRFADVTDWTVRKTKQTVTSN